MMKDGDLKSLNLDSRNKIKLSYLNLFKGQKAAMHISLNKWANQIQILMYLILSLYIFFFNSNKCILIKF